MRRAGLALLLIASVAAGPPDDRPRGTFISPMGEPFRGPGGPVAQIVAWFTAADTDHDGRLTPEEFAADAARFFKALDTDGDGEIDPAELRRYETIIAPEVHVAGVVGGRAGGGQTGGRGGGRHGGRGGGGGGEGGRGGRSGSAGSEDATPSSLHSAPASLGVEGAARFGLLDLPEPVAAADTDLDRSITRREFAEAAQARFDALDVDGDGYLTLAKLVRR